MSSDDQLLRRRLIAIATSTYDAFPPLNVEVEVDAVSAWLTDPALDKRAFSNDGDEALAAGPSFDEIRARFTAAGAFTDSYALVVYITGHGVVEGGRHYLALRDSAMGEISRTAVPTAQLITWLASYKDMSDVFLVIDVCQAGALTTDVTAELMQELPANWCVLATVPATADAKVGAFTSVLSEALDDIRHGLVDRVNEHDPYIPSSLLIGELKRRLREQHGQKLISLVDPYAMTACMPNPGYDATRNARVATADGRGDLAMFKSDLDPIWAARAPAVSATGGAFTGRRALLDNLIGFVEGPAGSLVVAGRAGSGKSAAIARVVTCSDEQFRAEHAEVLQAMSPLPAEGSVDVALVATGKTPLQIAERLAALLSAGPPKNETLDSIVDTVTAALRSRSAPATIVVDALDEGSDPLGILMSVLARIEQANDGKARLVVGVRSSADSAASQGSELADVAAALLRGGRIDVDSDELWEEADLRDYVAHVLALGREPTAIQQAAARLVAERASRSYVLAGLVAQGLTGEGASALEGADLEDLVHSLASRGVRDLVVQDVEARYPDQEDRQLVLLLLRASALSFGRGIPWRGLWALAASAISEPPRPVSQEDVAWFLRERASGYLLRDVEDDDVVYRPFHDLLRTELAGMEAGQPIAQAHAAITNALLNRYADHA